MPRLLAIVLLVALLATLTGCSSAPATDTPAPIVGPTPAGQGGTEACACEQGAPGVDGLDGADGARGDTGGPGPQGNPGSRGLPGADGVGSKGDTGATGATGDTGPPGGTPTLVVVQCELRVELVQTGGAIQRHYYAKLDYPSIDPANDSIRVMTCGGTYFRRDDSCDAASNTCTGPVPFMSEPGADCIQVPARIDHGSAWVRCGFEQWDSNGLTVRDKYQTARFTFK